jgi:hypothetical protein
MQENPYLQELLPSARRTASTGTNDQVNSHFNKLLMFVSVSQLSAPAGAIDGITLQAKLLDDSYFDLYKLSFLGRDFSIGAPKEVHVAKFVSPATFSDDTSILLDPAAGTVAILEDNADFVYVGLKNRFNKITVDLTVLASADGGALVVEYWNGTAWVPVAGLSDGTAVGANTMRVDGDVSFTMPSATAWKKNDPPTTGTNLFYVRMAITNTPATAPTVELVEPTLSIRENGTKAFLLGQELGDDAGNYHMPPVELVIPKSWRALIVHRAGGSGITYMVSSQYIPNVS